MVGFLAFIGSLILFIISLFLPRKNKLINPLSFFCGLWMFILFLSSLKMYNIITPSSKAYFLILAMISFFSIGYIFQKRFPIRKNKVKKTIDFESNERVLNLYYMICYLAIFFTIIDCLIIVMGISAKYPLYEIRRWGMVPFGEGGNPLVDRRPLIEEVFRVVCLDPFGLLVPAVTSYAFFKFKDRKTARKIIIISGIYLFLSNIASGFGRLGILYFILCFVFGFFLYKNTLTISKKMKRILLICLVIGISSMALFTVMRSGSNVFKQVYTYFAMPPTLLSTWMDTIEKVPHTYGFLSFYGIFGYFFRGLNMIGMSGLVPSVYDMSYNHILGAENFIFVGFGNANAFVTPIYYFYIDGGIPFVIIASLFFGFIVSRAFDKIENNINMKNYVLYCVIMFGLFVSFMRIQTCIPGYIISIILVYLLFNERIFSERKKSDE